MRIYQMASVGPDSLSLSLIIKVGEKEKHYIPCPNSFSESKHVERTHDICFDGLQKSHLQASKTKGS